MRRTLLALALTVAAGTAAAQEKQVITMPNARPGGAPLSTAIRVGNMLYLSGQLGLAPQGQPAGTTADEVRRAMENIKRVLEHAGSSMERVVKCTVFLADMADYQAMNEVYASYFPTDPPTRSTVAVAGLARNGRVEIECLAMAGK